MSLPEAGVGAEVVILAVPDQALAAVASDLARSLEPRALVVHLCGAHGVEVLEPLAAVRADIRCAAVHPLQTLSGRPSDADLLAGAWFAVDGHPDGFDLVRAVGGHPFTVADRAVYHAAAVVASNHLVALFGQVERLADAAGVPREAFGPLVRASLGHALDGGAAGALTGPVARGDADTVVLHLRALAPDERSSYRALAREALRLAGRIDLELERVLDDSGSTPAPGAPEGVSR